MDWFNQAIDNLINNLDDILKDDLNFHEELNRRFDTFKKQFKENNLDQLKIIEAMIEFTIQLEKMQMIGRAISITSRDYSIIFLHRKAIEIALEIVCLMENGLMNGVIARWRTLYEYTLVSEILFDHDEEIAERYLDYTAVCRKRISDDFNNRENTREIKNEYYDAIKSSGESIKSNYGWVQPLLPDKKFISLKSLSDLSKSELLKTFYRFASIGNQLNHASPMNTFEFNDIDEYFTNHRLDDWIFHTSVCLYMINGFYINRLNNYSEIKIQEWFQNNKIMSKDTIRNDLKELILYTVLYCQNINHTFFCKINNYSILGLESLYDFQLPIDFIYDIENSRYRYNGRVFKHKEVVNY